jgi:hypothetical protein
MTQLPRMIVHMLCLFSYLWASTCIANVLQIRQFNQQEHHTEIILDDMNGSFIIHHLEARGKHRLSVLDSPNANGDHVVKVACFHSDLSAFVNNVKLAKAQTIDVLLAYTPPPVVCYTATAKTLVLAAQPPPQPTPQPVTRNSSYCLVQLARLRI